MQVNPIGGLIGAFQAESAPYVKKSETGELSQSDMKELTELVQRFKAQAEEVGVKANQSDSSSLSITPLNVEEKLLERVEVIKEKNLEIQRTRFVDGVKSGELNYEDLNNSVLPFSDKMAILLTEGPRNGDAGSLWSGRSDRPRRWAAA